MTLRVGSLCTGYGGIELGLALAGEDVDLRWLAESDPALNVLHPAGVPNLGDITTVDWSQVEPVDLLTAGFPCQPVSAAGAQLAEADPRWLWPEVRRAVEALRPDRVLLENVRNLISMRKGEIWRYILDDLTALGYDVTWLTLGACAVGAAHHRHRVFALATRAVTNQQRAHVFRLPVQECGARRGQSVLPTVKTRDRRTSKRARELSHSRSGPSLEQALEIAQGIMPRELGDWSEAPPSWQPLDAMVPTPTATDARGSRNETAWRAPERDSHNAGTTLTDFAWIVDALLPTPAARDGDGRGEGDAAHWAEHRRSNGIPLAAELALLPTPRATVDAIGGPGQRGSSGDLAMPSAIQPEHWGRFAAAVARHAATFGPPPAPTEPNRNGAPRLAPTFAEWLMCIPAGHVTDALPRAAALKAIGNGVCPPQLAQAWRHLTGQLPPLDVSLGQPLASHLVTNDTEAISEIQQRNATARGRVIEATMAPNLHDMPELIQAAMMELAAVWREEAAWFTEQRRKGHVGIAKELTQAAARLAGFAIGLTSPPVATSTPPGPANDGSGGAWKTADGTEYPTEEARDDVTHAAYPLYGCTRHEQCRALPDPFPKPMTVGEAEDEAEDATIEATPSATAIDQVAACAHPDNARSTLKSGNILCTLCNAVVGQVEQLAEMVPGTRPGPVVTGDPTMDYLTGAVDTYEPRSAPVQPVITPAADNPFTSPASPGTNRAPVKRLTYGELGPLIAATYPVPRPHLSHSFVESMEECGLKALLSDAAKSQQIGPRRPGWSLIGGNAFHTCIEVIEKAALAMGGRAPTADMVEGGDWGTFWETAFTAAIDELTRSLVGTTYASSSTWHVANKGLEGFDWWRVQGAAMVARYVAFHDDAWRAQHILLQVPADPTSPDANAPRVPVLEFPFTVAAGSTAITTEGFIDASWLATTPEHPMATLEVVDFKTGSRTPGEHFQLVEYGAVLRRHLPVNFALPIVGRYWMARKGEYTAPIPLPADQGREEIDYRYRVADRAMRNAVFAPHPSNFCSGCTVVDYCPAQSHRDQVGA